MNNICRFTLGSTKIIIKDPVPVYKKMRVFKKHRNKRSWTPRVKVFSHWQEVIPNGEYGHDMINNVAYMNRTTFHRLEKAIEARNRAAGFNL